MAHMEISERMQKLFARSREVAKNPPQNTFNRDLHHGMKNLYAKPDLVPFEEAKLYGHNANHLLLAMMAAERGCNYMSEAANFPDIVEYTLQALIQESGAALCK